MNKTHRQSPQRRWQRGFLQWLSLWALLLGCSAFATAAEISVDVNRDTIGFNDQLVAVFQLRGDARATEPDFSALQSDFEILANYRSHQTNIVNDQVDSFTQWQLTLAPKRYGSLKIPSVTTAGASSQPVNITVTEPGEAPSGADRDVFMTVEVNHDSVYVQQQVLLSIKLFSKRNLRNKGIQNFQLDDAQIEAVAENEYVREINGTPHLVYEVTLAIYPQKSGTLTIPALQYEAELRGNGRSLLANLYGGAKERGQSKPVLIDVKPIPADYTGGTWLPAKSVSLSQHWSSRPDNLQAGVPVTRSITMTADGLSNNQLPPVNTEEATGFSYYQDKPQTDQQRSAKGIVSTRIDTVAMVPQTEGTFTLPAVTINWWNTQTERMETAELPAQTLTVAASLSDTQTPVAAPTPQTVDATQQLTGLSGTPATKLPLWILISQALTAAALLLFILLYLRERKRQPRRINLSAADDTPAWQTVGKAARSGNLPALRQALLHWASIEQGRPITRLDQLAREADSSELRQLCDALDRAIYRDAGTPSDDKFDTGALLKAVQNRRKSQRGKGSPKTTLDPLHPPV